MSSSSVRDEPIAVGKAKPAVPPDLAQAGDLAAARIAQLEREDAADAADLAAIAQDEARPLAPSTSLFGFVSALDDRVVGQDERRNRARIMAKRAVFRGLLARLAERARRRAAGFSVAPPIAEVVGDALPVRVSFAGVYFVASVEMLVNVLTRRKAPRAEAGVYKALKRHLEERFGKLPSGDDAVLECLLRALAEAELM